MMIKSKIAYIDKKNVFCQGYLSILNLKATFIHGLINPTEFSAKYQYPPKRKEISIHEND